MSVSPEAGRDGLAGLWGLAKLDRGLEPAWGHRGAWLYEPGKTLPLGLLRQTATGGPRNSYLATVCRKAWDYRKRHMPSTGRTVHGSLPRKVRKERSDTGRWSSFSKPVSHTATDPPTRQMQQSHSLPDNPRGAHHLQNTEHGQGHRAMGSTTYSHSLGLELFSLFLPLHPPPHWNDSSPNRHAAPGKHALVPDIPLASPPLQPSRLHSDATSRKSSLTELP